MLGDLSPTTDDQTAQATLIDLLSAWSNTLRAPRLGALGLTADHFPAVLGGVSANSLSGNPVTLGREDLESILLASL